MKDLLEKWRDKPLNELVDQIGHFFAGALIAYIVHKMTGSVAVAVGLSTLAAGIREAHQNFGDTDGSVWDSYLDQLVWFVGALFGGAI